MAYPLVIYYPVVNGGSDDSERARGMKIVPRKIPCKQWGSRSELRIEFPNHIIAWATRNPLESEAGPRKKAGLGDSEDIYRRDFDQAQQKSNISNIKNPTKQPYHVSNHKKQPLSQDFHGLPKGFHSQVEGEDQLAAP